MARVWWLVVPAVLVALGVAACAGSPGPLTADRRVRDLEPAPGSTVTNPVVLRWSTTVEPEDGLRFGVFLDTATTPPGAVVAPGGGAYVTEGTSVDAGVLPPVMSLAISSSV